MEEKKEFEISYIVKTENGIKSVKDLCSRHNGSVISGDEPKKIALAYPIKKEMYGFFGVIYVNLPTESVKEIEKESKLENEIIRMMIISEPIKVAHKDHEEEEKLQKIGEVIQDKDFDKKEKNQQDELDSKRKKSEDRAVTNEELEKKLEEILG